MELSVFAEFGLVIGLAAVLAIVATKLRQPAILGYILAGLIISLNPSLHPNQENLKLFSQVGITLLLFVLGLELSFNEVKSLGKVAIIGGLGQIVLSTLLGFGLGQLFGYSFYTSFYIAIGLTFSSTIVVVKLLSLKRQLESLFGRISIGFLLVQDLVAILIIICLSAFGNISGQNGIENLIYQLSITVIKGVLSGLGVYLFVKFILNPLLDWIRGEKEVLFLTVIAWALVLAGVMGSKYVGFTIEIGGLIAGIALADRFEHLQIESWTKPLRDFFLMLFFVLLGLEIDLSSIQNVLYPAILISLFVLISKPIIILILMKLLGYSKKISFLTAISLAQISEFSLIVTNFGKNLGQVNGNTLTLLTLVGGITMTISSYMIFYNENLLLLFDRLKLLDLFKFRETSNDENENKKYLPIILFGCHRMGRNVLNSLSNMKDQILVVDLDPKTVKLLKDEGYNATFGDIEDIELYEKYGIDNAKIVISTVPHIKENLRLLNYMKNLETQPLTVITANDDLSARELYDNSADFVIYPHLLGSEILSGIISKGSLGKSIVRMRNKQMEKLGRV